MNVISRLMRSRVETIVDKGRRGRWRNTPSHLSLILAGDFQSRMLKVNISHAFVMFGREVFGELLVKVFSSFLPVEPGRIFMWS